MCKLWSNWAREPWVTRMILGTERAIGPTDNLQQEANIDWQYRASFTW